MRLGIRTVPWLIAVAGLGTPLLAGGFAGWPYVVLWGMLLIVPWIVTRDQPAQVIEPSWETPDFRAIGAGIGSA